MILKTFATLYSAETFHSNKTNQDYNTVGLVIEGKAKAHFINKNDLEKIWGCPALEALRKTGEPQRVTATFNVYVTEKGWGASLTDLQK